MGGIVIRLLAVKSGGASDASFVSDGADVGGAGEFEAPVEVVGSVGSSVSAGYVIDDDPAEVDMFVVVVVVVVVSSDGSVAEIVVGVSVVRSAGRSVSAGDSVGVVGSDPIAE